MIIWSSRKLEEALAQGKLSNWTRVKYLIIPAVVGAFSGPVYLIRPRYGPRTQPFNALCACVCGILTAYLVYTGIRKCYRTNKQIDGKSFFERFVVLTVPVFVRVMVVAFTLSMTFLYATALTAERFPILANRASIVLVLTVFGPIVTYVLYALINRSFIRFRQVIQKQEPPGS